MVSAIVLIDFALFVLLVFVVARNSATVEAFTSPKIWLCVATKLARRRDADVALDSLLTGGEIQDQFKNCITPSSAEILKPKRSRRSKSLSPLIVADETRNPESKDSIRSSKNGDDEYWHWTVESDDFVLEYEDLDRKTAEGKSNGPSKLCFKIRGDPRPLRRHRSGNGHIYNPSYKYQRSFRKTVQALLFPEESNSNHLDDSRQKQDQTPLFGAHEHLAMVILFRMKRPKNHFINSKPGPGRLKQDSPPQLSTIRTDVDNLTKFVLDSMNGILYEDDRQITSMQITKLLDNDDQCQGSTEIHLWSIEADDLDSIISNPLRVIRNQITELS
jgi:Holliday junction resolvase RusA-like endonuclease